MHRALFHHSMGNTLFSRSNPKLYNLNYPNCGRIAMADILLAILYGQRQRPRSVCCALRAATLLLGLYPIPT